jgi:hypothetical protein
VLKARERRRLPVEHAGGVAAGRKLVEQVLLVVRPAQLPPTQADEQDEQRDRHEGRERTRRKQPGSYLYWHVILRSSSNRHRRGTVQFKYIVILFLGLILFSLFKALFHLSSAKPGQEGKMVSALAWRVGLSIVLFVLLYVAYYAGWITPLHH